MKASVKVKAVNLRMTAAQVVQEVVDQHRSLDDALADKTATPPPRDLALLREICYGACRHYHTLDGILAQLLSKPLKPHDRVLHFLLTVGCYQIEYMRTPDHAAVHQCVEAVAGTRFSWASKMLNGVLRNFIAQRERLQASLTPDARAAFPAWLYEEIHAQWPDHFERIIEAGNRKPPLTLRVNQRKISRDAYLEQLAQADVDASPTADSELGVTLAKPLPVERIPGFADGFASVQDESAQLTLAAVGLDDNGKGKRLLDGCAAPGGKTCLLLEARPGLAVVAVDLPDRIATLMQNLERLGLANKTEVEVIAGDLTQTEKWWDGRAFERILLDVPCTGSGIIRRHPDIKHRRRREDIAKFAEQQFNLLCQAWPLLADGGALLYVTCSILPAENDAVIEKFITGRQDVKLQRLDALPGIATAFGRQRLPGVHPGDGFYFCRLNKTAQQESTP